MHYLAQKRFLKNTHRWDSSTGCENKHENHKLHHLWFHYGKWYYQKTIRIVNRSWRAHGSKCKIHYREIVIWGLAFGSATSLVHAVVHNSGIIITLWRKDSCIWEIVDESGILVSLWEPVSFSGGVAESWSWTYSVGSKLGNLSKMKEVYQEHDCPENKSWISH